MPQSPEEMAASMIENLPEKTGKSLDQWLKITKKCGEEKHGGLVKYLKSEHGLTHGYASLIAHKTLASDAGSAASSDALVEAQYSGPKADLRPIFDAVVQAVSKLGSDVEISPKKSYVSLRRNKQFGLVQPSTKTRVDLGLNLKGVEPNGRLEASGSFNSMVSHRVRLSAKSDVDSEVLGWLKQAYEAS